MSKHLRGVLGFKLAAFGIDVGQDHLLSIIRPGQTICVSSLASTIGVRPSTVSKMIDRMARAGWIERRSVPGDARRVFIRLTPLGEHMRDKLIDAWSELDLELRLQLVDVEDVERQVAAIERRLAACL